MVSRDYLRHDFAGGHRPSFFATHPGTKGLVIGLVAIHFIMAILLKTEIGKDIWFFLSLQPLDVLQKLYVWQLVTGALLHAPNELGHILWNCFGIYIFGRYVEDRLGTKRFLVFCLAAALTASLCYLVGEIFEDNIRTMVGASGALMGLLVLVALWHPHMTILLFFVFPVKLWILAAVLVLIDLLGAINATGSIANMAHLGGALYGWIFYRYGGGVEKIFDAIDSYADKQKARKQAEHQRRAADLRREVDRILDKVNREGMSALSEEERRFLKDASDKLRG